MAPLSTHMDLRAHVGPASGVGVEECRLTPALSAALDVAAGDQVRVEGAGRAAAFTVSETGAGRDLDHAVALSAAGFSRLDTDAAFEGRVSATVPVEAPYDEAWRAGQYVETVWGDPGGRVLVLAPHGGAIEFGTDDVAVRVHRGLRERGHASTLWMGHGFGPDAFSRWHVSSNRMSARSYPALERVAAERYPCAVALHVHTEEYLSVGGLVDDAVREAVADGLRDGLPGRFGVRTEGGRNMGREPSNLVNRLTDGGASGLQVEMPPLVAYRYREHVVESVLDAVTTRL